MNQRNSSHIPLESILLVNCFEVLLFMLERERGRKKGMLIAVHMFQGSGWSHPPPPCKRCRLIKYTERKKPFLDIALVSRKKESCNSTDAAGWPSFFFPPGPDNRVDHFHYHVQVGSSSCFYFIGEESNRLQLPVVISLAAGLQYITPNLLIFMLLSPLLPLLSPMLFC